MILDRTTSASKWEKFEAAEQVDILTDPKSLRRLAPFIGCEHTVKGAAEELGVSQHAMLYWVKKLVKLDLLEVVRTEPRAGKPVKFYQAPAEHFVIPLNAVSAATFEMLLAQHHATWEELLRKSLVGSAHDAFERLHTWSLVVSKGEKAIRVDVTPEAGNDALGYDSMRQRLLTATAPALLDCWVPLGLSFEDAKNFQKELSDLLDRYERRPGAQDYLARIALAPISKR